ncbi:MAG: helix-turn-helix domain-containing protein [Pseudomonadota bacterium]
MHQRFEELGGWSFKDCIKDNLEGYFHDLRGAEPHAVYDMVVNAVERPMLEVVMLRAEGNQSRAAEWLGINRNTLRRKLMEHKLIK